MGGVRGRIGELIDDPPLRDRLAWRGLLRPRAREVGDTTVQASAFGLLFTVAAVAAVVAAGFDMRIVEDRRLTVAVAIGALLLALVCLVGYRRLSNGFFELVAALGIGLISLAAAASSPGAEAVFGPLYTVAVLLAMLLLRPPVAVAQAALAVVAYGIVLLARDNRFDLELLVSTTAMVAAIGGVVLVLRRRTTTIQGELSVEALTDQLTGIPNRRSFDQRFELERLRAQRSAEHLGLIICDLDHFKRVNDLGGHEAGDRALHRAAAEISDAVRAIDMTARLGGEEFGVILPGAGAAEAAEVAERIRERIREGLADGEAPLTASCGVASTAVPGADGRLFEQADRALYAAKDAGRDCTALAVDEAETRIIGGGSAVGRIRRLF